jgi:hypothetical protein
MKALKLLVLLFIFSQFSLSANAKSIAEGIPNTFSFEIKNKTSLKWGTCSDLLVKSLAISKMASQKSIDSESVLADILLSEGSSYGEYLALLQNAQSLKAQGNLKKHDQLVKKAQNLLKKFGKQWFKPSLVKHSESVILDTNGTIRGLSFKTFSDLVSFFSDKESVNEFKSMQMNSISVDFSHFWNDSLTKQLIPTFEHLETLAQEGFLTSLSLTYSAFRISEDYEEDLPTFYEMGNQLVSLFISKKAILTRLEHLTLDGMNLPDFNSLISKFENLTSLDLSRTVLPEGIEQFIATKKSLTRLSLLYAHIGEEGTNHRYTKPNLKHLSNLSELTELNIGGYFYYDSNDLIELAKLKKLTQLNIEQVQDSPKFSQESMKLFAKNLKELTHLQLSEVYLPLLQLPKLNMLTTTNAVVIDEPGLELIEKRRIKLVGEFFDILGESIDEE